MNEERKWANAWRNVPEVNRDKMRRLLALTIPDEIDGDWFWWAIVIIRNIQRHGSQDLLNWAEQDQDHPERWHAANRARLRQLALVGSEDLQEQYRDYL